MAHTRSARRARSRDRGTITYDDQHGHVCTCSRGPDAVGFEGSAGPTYDRTVDVDRDVAPTESGSWWYVCRRCGAGAWSGL